MGTSVSVALATFHGGEFLKEQMDSILAQLSEQDEVVVAYQPSRDDTLAILEDYAARDPRVRILHNPQTGVTSNFNLALSHCRGEYIFLSDQDDVWLPQKRQAVLDCFAQTGADMVIHDAVHTDQALHPQKETFFQIYPIGPGKLRNILLPRMSGCCMAMTRQMKDKLLPIPEIRGYDQWLAVGAEFLGEIAYLDQVLLLHRLHGENVTPSSRRSLSTILSCRARLVVALAKRLKREKRKKG